MGFWGQKNCLWGQTRLTILVPTLKGGCVVVWHEVGRSEVWEYRLRFVDVPQP